MAKSRILNKVIDEAVADFVVAHMTEIEEKLADVLSEIVQEKFGDIYNLIVREMQQEGFKGDPGYTPVLGVDFSVPSKEEITDALKGDKNFLKSLRPKGELLNKIKELSGEEVKKKIEEYNNEHKNEEWFNAENIFGLRNIVRNAIPNMTKLGGGGGGTLQDITVTGTINGSNTSFTLDRNYAFLALYMNGQRIRSGNTCSATVDYTKSGTTITMCVAPPTDSVLHGEGQPG